MNSKKISFFLVSFTVFMFFLSSNSYCIELEEQEKYRIVVIPKGSRNEFWSDIKLGAEKGAAKYGVDLIYRGPKYDNDIQSQINLLKKYINEKVDAIVLAPIDKENLNDLLREAAKRDIKIIIIDTGIKGSYYKSFIATDNFSAGKFAGEKLSGLLKDNRKVALLRFNKGTSSTDLREEGFLEEMKNRGIEVVADEYGGVTVGAAYRKALEILDREEGIEGIFTSAEVLTEGMAKAIKEKKLENDISLVGFDSNQKINEYLKEGAVDGLILQNPVLMGYLGIEAAVRSLMGDEVDERITVNVEYFESY